jgi:hypothetical protein
MTRRDLFVVVADLDTENAVRSLLCVVVVDPELEAWVWADSPHVAAILGWPNNDAMRSLLVARQCWQEGAPKPQRPKEAMHQALREKNKPIGAPLFSELAKRVSFSRCTDPAFNKLRDQLKRWFPKQSDR